MNTVICGHSYPDPRAEELVRELRAAIGAPPDTSGCGRWLRLKNAYRCVECGRWFHRDCIRKHFEAHRDSPTLSGELAIAAGAITSGQRLASGMRDEPG